MATNLLQLQRAGETSNRVADLHMCSDVRQFFPVRAGKMELRDISTRSKVKHCQCNDAGAFIGFGTVCPIARGILQPEVTCNVPEMTIPGRMDKMAGYEPRQSQPLTHQWVPVPSVT
jgi:hypothetical protein